MKKIQLIAQEIFHLLQERIIDSQKVWMNSEFNMKQINMYQNLMKLLNMIMKQDYDQKILKQLYKGSLVIFQRMKGQFVGETNYRYDFEMLIKLYKKYAVQKKDLRMIIKTEQMMRRKINQKVILELLKILIEETNHYVAEKIKRFNKIISYRQSYQNKQVKNKQEIVFKNRNVLYPVFGEGKYRPLPLKTPQNLLRNSYATVINSTPVQRNRHLVLSFEKKHKKTVSDLGSMRDFLQTKQKPIAKMPFTIKNLIIKSKQNDPQQKSSQTSELSKRRIVIRTKTSPQITQSKPLLFLNSPHNQPHQPSSSYHSFMNTFNILDIDQSSTFSLFTRSYRFKFLLQQSLNRNKDIYKSLSSNTQQIK